MAVYEFRCRTCDDVFEVSRPMSDAGLPAACPAGHADTVKLLSAFASVGRSAGAAAASPGAGPAAGGWSGGG
ncbi:MAG: FmdB family zinc ribbon protein, partial [Acidimicrobiales bacterium]